MNIITSSDETALPRPLMERRNFLKLTLAASLPASPVSLPVWDTPREPAIHRDFWSLDYHAIDD